MNSTSIESQQRWMWRKWPVYQVLAVSKSCHMSRPVENDWELKTCTSMQYAQIHILTHTTARIFYLTKIPVTRQTSNIVGNTLNTSAVRTQLIPLGNVQKEKLLNTQSSDSKVLDLPCSSIHCSRHGPCLTRQVKVQVQWMKVEECSSSHPACGWLCYFGKHSIS